MRVVIIIIYSTTFHKNSLQLYAHLSAVKL